MAYRGSVLSETILVKSKMAFDGCMDAIEYHSIVDLCYDSNEMYSSVIISVERFYDLGTGMILVSDH